MSLSPDLGLGDNELHKTLQLFLISLRHSFCFSKHPMPFDSAPLEGIGTFRYTHVDA